MGKRICFVSTYIGDSNLKDISDNFIKNPKYDYLFFTNLQKEEVKSKSWEVIQVNLDNFKDIKNNVKISRYFKFFIFNYLKKIGRNYNYVFYNDCHLYPDPKINWDKIADNIKKHTLKSNNIGIVQYNHPKIRHGIKQDLENIVRFRKDTQENMDKTKKFLNKIDSEINLKTPQYYENTVLGFYLKDNKVIRFQKKFWEKYLKCPTYRDQPLWNYMYLKLKVKPLVDNNLRSYFKGDKKIERRIEHYK
jgi:hypothetical protein